MGKPEIQLAYKMGALSILHNENVASALDPEVKERIEESLGEAFEKWYQAVEQLFKLTGNAP